jgi:hypothetical protein
MTVEMDDLRLGIGMHHIVILDGPGEDRDASPGQVVKGPPATTSGGGAGQGGMRLGFAARLPPGGGQIFLQDQGSRVFMVIGGGKIDLGPTFLGDGKSRHNHVDFANGEGGEEGVKL